MFRPINDNREKTIKGESTMTARVQRQEEGSIRSKNKSKHVSGQRVLFLFLVSIYCLTFLIAVVTIDLRLYDNTQKASLDNYASGSGGNKLGSKGPRPVLTAYIEEIDQEEWSMKPLPMRRNADASKLRKVTYPELKSCKSLPSQWPTDDYPDDDPFLPWIHDVFPSPDGTLVHFIAQNKRRCHTTALQQPDIVNTSRHMQPQVSLFQHVPVKRIAAAGNETRYRLASHEEADDNGIQTRFICRFKPSMAETLSSFHVDYEYATYRKRYSGRRTMFSENNRDFNNIWNAQLFFNCPVPAELQHVLQSGESVVDDYATLFVDLVPIRTPPRYGSADEFLPPKYGIPNTFDADTEFGKQHTLPLIHDSGRWENIPICKPSLQTYRTTQDTSTVNHTLIAFTWTANNYKTRKQMNVPDGERRLMEWITFHLLVGFDHLYIYDNTKAFDKNSSLQHVTDQFPPSKVTRIDWPAAVCNNNPNNVDDRGERSSQYAAEASCLLRFGTYHAKWMTTLDIDEYLIPVGKYKNLKHILNDVEKEDIRILSFASFRTRPLLNRFEPPTISACYGKSKCFVPTVPKNTSFLYTYNCENEKPPKQITNPAEKQIYRTDYVRLHFIHYSSITSDMLKTKTDYITSNMEWRERYNEVKHRFTNELTEATMLHTKAVPYEQTKNYDTICKEKKHYFGFAWPNGTESDTNVTDKDGYYYTCFVNDIVDRYWVPKLHKALGLGTPSLH